MGSIHALSCVDREGVIEKNVGEQILFGNGCNASGHRSFLFWTF